MYRKGGIRHKKRDVDRQAGRQINRQKQRDGEICDKAERVAKIEIRTDKNKHSPIRIQLF